MQTECRNDESRGRRGAAGAHAGAAYFRQVVFEDDKNLSLVPVRVRHPCLILDRVAAGGLHLVARGKPGLGPYLAHC
jgi:hypothetical protein